MSAITLHYHTLQDDTTTTINTIYSGIIDATPDNKVVAAFYHRHPLAVLSYLCPSSFTKWQR
jgi:hypothetical protein